MRTITIKFKKRTAIISLSRKAFESRTHGLIQFVGKFCDSVIYEILDEEPTDENHLFKDAQKVHDDINSELGR